jgi:predicted secreted hydrolase
LKSIVAVSHLDLSAEWLLVVEELTKEDAAKFGVQYKVVNRSQVMQAMCVDAPLERYTGDPAAYPRLVQMEGWYCYDMRNLPRK